MTSLAWLAKMLQVQEQFLQVKDNQFNMTLARFISVLLLEMDQKHFSELALLSQSSNEKYQQRIDEFYKPFSQGISNQCEDTFITITTKIYDYFIEKQFKRPKKHFQKQLIDTKSSEELLKLILYLSLTSPIKKKSVEIILEFSEPEQKELMKIVQDIDHNMQHLVEMKQIVEKIQDIQKNNEQLQQRYKEEMIELERVTYIIKQMEIQNTIMLQENKKYIDEKKAVLDYVHAQSIIQYIEKCKRIKSQNLKVADQSREMQQINQNLQLQSQRLKRILKDRGGVITKQYEQLQRLKYQCKLLKEEGIDYQLMTSVNYHSFSHILSITPLEINQNRRNIQSNKAEADHNIGKQETERTNCSIQSLDDDSFQQKNNLGILLQIKKLQQEEKIKIELLKNLKSGNFEKRKKLKHHQQTIKDIKSQHGKCMQMYNNTVVCVK